MKRILSFLFGLWILLVVGVLLFVFLDIDSLQSDQQELQQYRWFLPTVYWSAGLLMFVALVMMLFAFRPSYKSKGLLLSYQDGELYIDKKSIEKTVLHTIRKYDHVLQPSVNVQLFQKKQSSYIDVNVDLFVIQTANIQTYLQTIREDIKANAESFAELPVREVSLNLLDQKMLNKRVL
ncbi:MAG: alkaline shock response membrane anchor protein AmaP [Solibacillus sp.]